MKIYLLRHGKTREHEKQIRQHPGSDLGEEGLRQADKVSYRLANEPIEMIISSPWPRALNTAKIVSAKLGLPLLIDENIHELVQNPVLNSLPHGHSLNQEYLQAIAKDGKDVDWKFKGAGESVRDVIKRVRVFKKQLLKNHFGKNVLIVSHGYILSTITALFITDDETDDQVLKNVVTSLLSHENTALSLLQFHEARQIWKLMYFNDHSHLRS